MGTTNILDLNNRLTKVEKENVAQNNYNSLQNRPKINGNLLTGNKTGAQLGLVSSEEMTPSSSNVTINSAYNAGAWNITRMGLLRLLNVKNLKDLPAGASTTEIAQLAEGDRPSTEIYHSVYAWNFNKAFAIKISTDGKVSLVASSGQTATSGTSYLNEVIPYTV